MSGPGAARFPCYYTVDSQPPISENMVGTTKLDFVPLFRDHEMSSGTFELYQNIGFQRPCQGYSLEELRLIDYTQSRDLTEDDKVARDPSKLTAIESLPEELVTEFAQRIGSNDLKSLRLASRRLSKTSLYAFAQCIPSKLHVTLTESGLRSVLPLSRNYDLAGRISQISLSSPIVIEDAEDSRQEHVCHKDPGQADCPIRIQKSLVNGCSELHIRLLSEILGNLRNLRRVELRAFPMMDRREMGLLSLQARDERFPARYPMSSWAFHCVAAAIQRAAKPQLPELGFEEVELFSQYGYPQKLGKPPATDTSPLSWELGSISGLKSLGFCLRYTEQLDGAVRHQSMFRYMRAILAAVAPDIESFTLSSPDRGQREVLNGVLGDGVRLPKLKYLFLTRCRVTFETLKAVLLMHEATLEHVEIRECRMHMEDWQVEEICEIVERRERKLWVTHCSGCAPFPSKYAKREENKALFEIGWRNR